MTSTIITQAGQLAVSLPGIEDASERVEALCSALRIIAEAMHEPTYRADCELLNTADDLEGKMQRFIGSYNTMKTFDKLIADMRSAT